MQAGDRLGGFELLEELGRGGMGVVFKARDLSLNRVVALKVLLHGLSSEAEYIQRFKREAQIIATLRHPSIVGILSYGEAEGRYYFAMEYIAGSDLGRLLQERITLPIGEALAMTAQIASALEEANARGITHRDIKPSNILIDAAGDALITDFGIARLVESQEELTRTGMFFGTPEYASPELAKGTVLDVRSDIYSLGAVLYKSLSGETPVTGDSALAVMVKISTEGATPLAKLNPTLPAPLCSLVERMMAVDPESRPQTPRELLDAIGECERMLAGSTAAPLAKTIAVRPTPRGLLSSIRPWVQAGSALGALLAVLLLVWSVQGLIPEARQDDAPSPRTMASEAELSPISASIDLTPTSSIGGPKAEAGRELVSSAPPKTPPPLPRRPAVLVVVFGDEAMVPLVRAQVESQFLGSDLEVITVAEIPVLRRKLQLGPSRSWSWYDVREFVPAHQAQVVVLARIQKTGSTPLRFYGRIEEMTLASFSVQTIDMASGHSIHADSTGSIQFTALNMSQNLQSAIESVVDGLGARISEYWEQKRRASETSKHG